MMVSNNKTIVEHVNHNKTIQYVVNTMGHWKDDKFSLIFVEEKIGERVIGIRGVSLYLTPSGVPEGWKEEKYKNVDIRINTLSSNNNLHYIQIGENQYWRTGEDWTNYHRGIYQRKNWYDFYKESGKVDSTFSFKELVCWSPNTSIYKFCCPVNWELTFQQEVTD